MEATKVIDVSHHQGAIDWEQVKNAGIAGVIIRCGYGMDQASRMTGSGRGMPMPARDLGFPSEHISILTPTASRRRQAKAQHALRLLAGYRLSYPVYYDIEKAGTENGAAERARVFCEKIRSAGYLPGVYANKNWWDHYLTDLTEYTRWVARYSDTLGMEDVDLWQYTSGGTVPGIAGRVDLNRCYRDFPAEIGPGSISAPGAPAKEQIKVDGKWGEATTRRLQQILGTAVDGKVSHQFASYRASNPGLDYGSFQWESNPSGYSPVMKAFQGCLNIWINAG